MDLGKAHKYFSKYPNPAPVFTYHSSMNYYPGYSRVDILRKT